MVQIPIISTDGKQSVTVTVESVTQTEYDSIRQYLTSQLHSNRNFEAIAATFIYAINLCPKANPSDIWQHIIYRSYLNAGANEQSWKRASGQAFEYAFVELYNIHLVTHSLKLAVLTPRTRSIALAEMGLSNQVGQAKLDISIIGNCGTGGKAPQWKLIGGVHGKVSIAERITDDEPASRAMMAKGYFSPVVTLDSKSFPPPHGDGLNKGELGLPRPGRRADKRDYFEVHGSFSGCYSYNLRTPPSPPVTQSGYKIKVLSFTEPQPDYFVSDLIQMWNNTKATRCMQPNTGIVQ